MNAISSREHRAIMLIGDQPAQTRLMADRACWAGWRTIVCLDVGRALAMLDPEPDPPVSVFLLDEAASGGAPEEAIARLKARRPRVPIVLISCGRRRIPINALRAGAGDYLIPPVTPDRLLEALLGAARRAWPHRHDLEPLTERFETATRFAHLIGADPSFRAALAQAAASARGDGAVLIEGERGTGKTALARAIHAASAHASGPLRVLRPGGLSEEALESVLFGHERGAFVGAFERREGLLQTCHGGTLVLSHVNCLPAGTQQRLAEALTQHRVRPIGASEGSPLGARVIALSSSSNGSSLSELVSGGDFNPALYKALTATGIRLPPLRDREDDVALLAQHFLGWLRAKADLPELALTADALALLCRFHWPANVRQLQSVLFRAAIFASCGTLTAEDFPHIAKQVSRIEAPQGPLAAAIVDGISLYTEEGRLRTLAEIEADVIRFAVAHYQGRMSEVARQLGVGRSTLYRKVSSLGIDRPLN